MSRTIAMKAFAAGDKVFPFISEPWRRTYTSLAVSQRSNAGPSPVAAAVTCWIERANEANEKARRGCSGGL
jgi:hypothetical protein